MKKTLTSKAISAFSAEFPKEKIEAKIAQLIFACLPFEGNENYRLAYKMFINIGNNASKSFNAYFDAKNGALIYKEPIVCSTNAPGTAQTIYSGNQNFTTDAVSGQFRLRETRNGVNILTLNANHFSDKNQIVSNATDFFDYDNNWTQAEHPNDQAAHDVHWASERVLDYWKQVRGRNSIDGNGLQLKSFVHIDNNYNNAYWDKIEKSAFYGDGGSTFSSLTSLDVCAHEIGHGITQFTSNLDYSGEPGALNEGFSDIWGATIEAWAAPTKQRWLIGEEITLVSPFYLRNMENPQIGLGFPSPDTYGNVNWQSGPDPHYTSGILNKWYFLLTDGGTGTNGIGNNYNVCGIGIDRASAIAYKTLQTLNSSATYAVARSTSIQAAQTLYGANSFEVAMVTRAWFAVGVGANFSGSFGSPSLTIAGPAFVCTSSIYSIPNLPQGSTVNWSISPTSPQFQLSLNNPAPNQLTISSTQGGSSFSTTLSASISNAGCAVSNLVCTKVIRKDNSTSASADYPGHQDACNYLGTNHPVENYNVSTNAANFIHAGCLNYVGFFDNFGKTITLDPVVPSPISWSVGSGYFSGPNLIMQLPTGGSPYVFRINYDGGCYQRTLLFFTYTNNGKFSITANPNPVKDFMTIKIDAEADKYNQTTPYSYHLYSLSDNSLQLSGKVPLGSKMVNINTSTLKTGYYVLSLSDGVESQVLKIFKQ